MKNEELKKPFESPTWQILREGNIEKYFKKH